MSDADGGAAPDTSAPKPLTAEDVAKIVNSALTAREARFETKFTKTLEERIAAATKPRETPQEEPGADHPVAGKGEAVKVDPRLLSLERTTKELQGQLQKSEEARNAAEKRARIEKSESELRTELAKHVKPELLAAAFKMHRSEIAFDEEGNPQMPVEGGVTTIGAFAEAWAKSAEGNHFRAAPSSGGSGAKRLGGGSINMTTLASKPRNTWTQADHDFYFQENLRRNSGG